MLVRTLKMAFWVCYDHAGKLVLANLMWALSFGVPALVSIALLGGAQSAVALVASGAVAVFASCGALPVVTAGLAHMVKELIDTGDGSVKTMFAGMRLYWGRAVVLGVAYLAGAALLCVGFFFYTARLGRQAPLVGYALGGVTLWALVFLLLSALFLFPALVQKKRSAWATFKLAALLVMDNALLAVGLGFWVVLLTLLAVAPVVLVLLYGAAVMALVSAAYELVARNYAARRGEPVVPDGEDDYLNRGLRDFIFPWKG